MKLKTINLYSLSDKEVYEIVKKIYCINCKKILDWSDIRRVKIWFCTNEKCSRYGLYTVVLDVEIERKER